jgi:hypothetical protein
MLTLGTLTTVANTGVFYANNMGWDLYEWWTTPVFPAPAAPGIRAEIVRAAPATP